MKYSAPFSLKLFQSRGEDLLLTKRLKNLILKGHCSSGLSAHVDVPGLHYLISKFSLRLDLDLNRVRTFSECSGVLCTRQMATRSGIDVNKELLLPFHCNAARDATATEADQQIFGATEALQNAIKASSECLLNGGVLGVPTDTIYGIAGLAQNDKAVNRMYDIKQRNYEKPVAISVGTIDDIYRWSKVTVPRELLSDLLPGPVTVVFERSSELNPALNPKTSLVGIRIPNHIFMKELALKCNSPIALTSANVSGDKSCLQIEEFQHLWPLLDLVVNGGKLNDSEESRLGSTVVDLSCEGTFRIIRPGSAHTATCAVLQNDYNLKETSQMGSSR